ncbi:cytochrome c oxidase subunit II [Zavarzinia sp. CC-PAN008]|uniref:cytochrome c oxidase subunit II n=1 Tax=Zavarzinia sp. CC-PAN008 TaxID=3243332 RepID=UPI003F74450F
MSALAACGGDYSTLAPVGPAASGIATLWWIMLVGAVLILLGVSLVVALSLNRTAATRLSPRGLILWGGLVFPSVVLTVLVLGAFILGGQLLASPREPTPMRIEAEASRWQWRFTYPEAGRHSTNIMHMPVGRPVDIVVTSTDVIHSFWVPRIGGKIDAIPGHANVIRLQADEVGRFGGVCAEYCGVGHSAMAFWAVAHDAETFAAAMAGLAE